jgi:hypothetical protein
MEGIWTPGRGVHRQDLKARLPFFHILGEIHLFFLAQFKRMSAMLAKTPDEFVSVQ